MILPMAPPLFITNYPTKQDMNPDLMKSQQRKALIPNALCQYTHSIQMSRSMIAIVTMLSLDNAIYLGLWVLIKKKVLRFGVFFFFISLIVLLYALDHTWSYHISTSQQAPICEILPKDYFHLPLFDMIVCRTQFTRLLLKCVRVHS